MSFEDELMEFKEFLENTLESAGIDKEFFLHELDMMDEEWEKGYTDIPLVRNEIQYQRFLHLATEITQLADKEDRVDIELIPARFYGLVTLSSGYIFWMPDKVKILSRILKYTDQFEISWKTDELFDIEFTVYNVFEEKES